MFEITPEIARIHAHICADGYLAHSVYKRSKKDLESHPRKKVTRDWYEIRYTAQNETLQNNFRKDVMIGLQRKCVFCSSKRELVVAGKKIFEQFVLLGAGKSRDWFISRKILYSDDKVIAAWLNAFFDDEGTVDYSRNRVRAKSVNLKGLEQVNRMLQKIGINSHITGPNNDNTWYVTTKDLKKFNNLIGFSEPNKKIKLENLIKV